MTATKGLRGAAAVPVEARATSSLPLPLSPVISTVASLGATRQASWSTARRAGLSATMPASDLGGQAVGSAVAPEADDVAAGGHQLVQVDRLAQVVHRAQLQGRHGLGHVGEGGHQEEGQVGAAAAGLAQHLQAVHAGHAHVADHQGGALAPQQGQGDAAVGGLDHVEARLAQGGGVEVAVGGLVVHDQHAGGGAGRS